MKLPRFQASAQKATETRPDKAYKRHGPLDRARNDNTAEQVPNQSPVESTPVQVPWFWFEGPGLTDVSLISLRVSGKRSDMDLRTLLREGCCRRLPDYGD